MLVRERGREIKGRRQRKQEKENHAARLWPCARDRSFNFCAFLNCSKWNVFTFPPTSPSILGLPPPCSSLRWPQFPPTDAAGDKSSNAFISSLEVLLFFLYYKQIYSTSIFLWSRGPLYQKATCVSRPDERDPSPSAARAKDRVHQVSAGSWDTWLGSLNFKNIKLVH